MQIDLFWKKYNRLTTFDLETFHYSNIANDGKGETKGLNIFWKNSYKNLEYWLSYGYVDANIQSGNFRKLLPPPYVSKHAFNSTLKYWINKTKTMIGSSFFIDSGSNSYKMNEPEITVKTPYRSRLDISLSYLPTPFLIVHFSCQNVLGRNNIYGYEYSSVNDKYREITNPATRFYYIGVFLTISKSKTNQLNSL